MSMPFTVTHVRAPCLQSAVSQNCILLPWKIPASQRFRSPADCKSAIQQIENLRYVQPPFFALSIMLTNPPIPSLPPALRPLVFPLGILACYWLHLVHQLGAQWSLYEQYNYGWSVP